MARKIGGLGAMLFAIGGSLEASPDAPWSVVMIPYGIIIAGLVLIGVAIAIHKMYYFGDDDDYLDF